MNKADEANKADKADKCAKREAAAVPGVCSRAAISALASAPGNSALSHITVLPACLHRAQPHSSGAGCLHRTELCYLLQLLCCRAVCPGASHALSSMCSAGCFVAAVAQVASTQGKSVAGLFCLV